MKSNANDECCSKTIQSQGLTLRIMDNGKAVRLEKKNQDFAVTLLEKDANLENQNIINLKPDDVIQDTQIKHVIDQEKGICTKAMFLKDYRGIVVRWSSGLKSKFEYTIDQ